MKTDSYRYLLTVLLCVAGSVSGWGNDYKPMLEQGKTWKYSLVNWASIYYPSEYYDYPIERLRETRLEGYETIDGEIYMKLNVYIDGADTPSENSPMYYLREDTETGKVMFYPNYYYFDEVSWEAAPNQDWIYRDWCIGTPGLLYDFNATDGRNFSRYETKSESSVTLADGEHRCYEIDNYYLDTSTWLVIEGIGLITDANHRGCSILGESMSGIPSFPDRYFDSYLYEVVGGDGEVIYSDDNHRPGRWQSFLGISDLQVKPAIEVTKDGILITGAQGLEACLYDMQGRIVKCGYTDNGNLSISTCGMSAGVYLLRLGLQTYKIAVK